MLNEIVRWRNSHHKTLTLEAMSKSTEVIVFDTETTGFKHLEDRIIEIGAIKYSISGTDICEIEKLHIYIRPPFEVSEEIEKLTGITNCQLSGCPYEEAVFPAIKQFFTTEPQIVVAHNAPFDIRFMKALYERNSCEFSPNFVINTLEMARDLVDANDVKNYKLGTLADAFGLSEGISFHSAIDDVTVTAMLFKIFYKEYLEKGSLFKTGTIKPRIHSVCFWKGFEGFSRIYVQTSLGSVFYDIRRKVWQPKDADMDSIDMIYLEDIVIKLTKSDNIDEFAKFQGKIKC